MRNNDRRLDSRGIYLQELNPREENNSFAKELKPSEKAKRMEIYNYLLSSFWQAFNFENKIKNQKWIGEENEVVNGLTS